MDNCSAKGACLAGPPPCVTPELHHQRRAPLAHLCLRSQTCQVEWLSIGTFTVQKYTYPSVIIMKTNFVIADVT